MLDTPRNGDTATRKQCQVRKQLGDVLSYTGTQAWPPKAESYNLTFSLPRDIHVSFKFPMQPCQKRYYSRILRFFRSATGQENELEIAGFRND